MKKLSIITINWNNREGLRMTMENVLGQTARDQFEYIVVDGGAADGSKEMLSTEYDGKVDKWISEPIKPIYQKMNMGVQMATGEYLLFLNSGDNLHGNHAIQDVINLLHGEDIIIGETVMLETGKNMVAHSPLTLLSLYNHSIPHNAAFIRRELLISYPYDEDLRIVSDWKFFVEALILNNCSYRIIDKVIAEFDCNGLSSKNRDLCEQEREKALCEMFPRRVLVDYLRFAKGGGYEDTDYDRFFVKLRNYKVRKYLYAFDVFVMRVFSLFKKSARWARIFPIQLEK